MEIEEVKCMYCGCLTDNVLLRICDMVCANMLIEDCGGRLPKLPAILRRNKMEVK